MPLPFQASDELTQLKRRCDVKLPDKSGMPFLPACALTLYRVASNKNHARRSASSIHTSIRLVVA